MLPYAIWLAEPESSNSESASTSDESSEWRSSEDDYKPAKKWLRKKRIASRPSSRVPQQSHHYHHQSHGEERMGSHNKAPVNNGYMMGCGGIFDEEPGFGGSFGGGKDPMQSQSQRNPGTLSQEPMLVGPSTFVQYPDDFVQFYYLYFDDSFLSATSHLLYWRYQCNFSGKLLSASCSILRCQVCMHSFACQPYGGGAQVQHVRTHWQAMCLSLAGRRCTCIGLTSTYICFAWQLSQLRASRRNEQVNFKSLLNCIDIPWVQIASWKQEQCLLWSQICTMIVIVKLARLSDDMDTMNCWASICKGIGQLKIMPACFLTTQAFKQEVFDIGSEIFSFCNRHCRSMGSGSPLDRIAHKADIRVSLAEHHLACKSNNPNSPFYMYNCL